MPSAEWKLRVLKAPWYAGETVSVAIGQGQVSATPIQMARVAAFVANGGRLVRPHFARQARTPQLPPIVKPETIAAVKEGMRRVVAEGTGARARLSEVEVCGKTGSAQVVGHARLEKSPSVHEMQPHGWFICFAPADRPTIALAVLVEHGRSGGESAAPVARRILAHYFGIERGLPTPAGGVVDTADAED
jgi:penicillin-binding protein 2